MAMTCTQMETEVRYNLGGRTDLDSRLATFINWAQTEIARQYSFRELQQVDTTKSTVKSQDYILAPTGLKNLYSIRLFDGTRSRKLIYVPERRFDALIPKPNEYTEDRPTHFYIWSGKFYLWRIPDAVYSTSIKYTKWPADISGSSTSELLYLDEALVCLATAKALDSVDADAGIRQKWSNRAQRHINLAILRDKNSYTDEEVQGSYNLSDSAPNYWEDPFVKGVRGGLY